MICRAAGFARCQTKEKLLALLYTNQEGALDLLCSALAGDIPSYINEIRKQLKRCSPGGSASAIEMEHGSLDRYKPGLSINGAVIRSRGI